MEFYNSLKRWNFIIQIIKPVSMKGRTTSINKMTFFKIPSLIIVSESFCPSKSNFCLELSDVV